VSELAAARWRRAALAAVAAALVLRLIGLVCVDLIPEEAYYWSYAQHLDLGYLDHPPMVAWLIRLGGALLGHRELAVRSGAFACWLVAAGFSYGLARHAFDRATALRAVLLLAVLPYFFAAGIVMTPDAPLLAAWAGALFFLERALLGGNARAWWGAGACLGLGMLSKYSIALLGVATLAFVWIDAPSRRWLRRPEPYLAAALALAIFSPVIAWNAGHGWASFAFQSARRLAKPAEFGLPWLAAGALLWLTPIGVAAAAALCLERSGHGPSEGERRVRRFARVFTLCPLAVFAAFSLRHGVRLNWTGPVWLALLPVLARWIARDARAAGAAAATVLALLAAYGAALLYLTLGLPGIGYPPKLRLPVGWRELGEQVASLAEPLERETGSRPLLVGMDHYFIASELAFYAGGAGEATGRHLFGRHDLMYERWAPARRCDGRPLVLISFDREDLADPSLDAWAEGFGAIREHRLERDGRGVGRFFSRAARRYRADAQLAGMSSGQFEATVPPSTSKTLPVTQSPAGEHR